MIVSDANIFINLLKVESIDILHKLYNQIYIPQAVYDELKIKNDKCFKDVISADFVNRITLSKENEIEAERIRVNYFLSVKEFKENNERKHLGECQAIVLLKNISDGKRLFLSDDLTARNICSENEEIREYKIFITGTLGIIKQAYEKEFITFSKAIDDVNKIREINPYWSDELFENVKLSIKLNEIKNKKSNDKGR